ncbi:MAG: hypothetical protein V4649_12920 [Bacteroidota bacterium]
MYLAIPVVKPIAARKLALGDGEGTKGYLFEGQFAYRFVIYQGKYYSYPFLQKLRTTFDVSLLLRLTRDNKSYPMLPTNNKVGFGVDYLWSKIDKMSDNKSTLVWTTLQLHHYSNGASDSFFVNSPVQRNNYRAGDFTTNYCRILMNVGSNSGQKNIVSASLGYQREIDLGGPLIRSKELAHYYGYDRLLFGFQIATKPRLVTSSYHNRSTSHREKVNIERKRQMTARTELEHIAGDLSKFAGKNKYRAGWHTYLTFMPSITNDVGLLVHTYVGRDYLNMRFDDVVFIGEVGAYVKFNSR